MEKPELSLHQAHQPGGCVCVHLCLTGFQLTHVFKVVEEVAFMLPNEISLTIF